MIPREALLWLSSLVLHGVLLQERRPEVEGEIHAIGHATAADDDIEDGARFATAALCNSCIQYIFTISTISLLICTLNGNATLSRDLTRSLFFLVPFR